MPTLTGLASSLITTNAGHGLQVETDFAFRRRRKCLHLVHVVRETVDIFDENLYDGRRAVMAAFQLFNASRDILFDAISSRMQTNASTTRILISTARALFNTDDMSVVSSRRRAVRDSAHAAQCWWDRQDAVADGRPLLAGCVYFAASAIYEPGFQQLGSDLRTIVEAVLHGFQFVDVVGHIAHAGDAGGHVHQAIVGLQVNMHVPEARHEGLVGGVNDFRTLGSPDFLVIADSGDFVAGNYHGAVGMESRALGVEKVCVHQDERSGRFMTQLSCQIRGALVRDPILRLEKCVDGGFPAFTNDRKPRGYGREKRALLVQPDGGGGEIQTRDGVLCHGAGVAVGFDLQFAALFVRGGGASTCGRRASGRWIRYSCLYCSKLLQRICAIRLSGQYVSGCEIMELPRMGG
jgi:hypothetical protein